MMILNNIGKDNDKLYKNNTLESKSMATCQMGIMNWTVIPQKIKNYITSKAPMSGMTPQTKTMKTCNNNTRDKYQIDTKEQDAPVDRDEDT